MNFERRNASIKMHKIIFFPEKKNVCLPYLKFSDPLPDFLFSLSYLPEGKNIYVHQRVATEKSS